MEHGAKKVLRAVLAPVVVGLRNARDWTIAMAVIATLKVVSLLPAEKAITFIDWAARRIGPHVPRHRLALRNLAMAFPEKTEAEREAIANDMWGSMARLAVEYIFLDQLFDFDVEKPDEGRIEVGGVEIFRELQASREPFIVFTAHTGNFELLPVAAAAYGLDVTALFRPPNNPYIARRLLAARQTAMGHLVPSRAGAAIALARKLDEGKGVGVLVDQKFYRGETTTFFGGEVITNPLLAKLARQYGCKVYPARSIRLPGGRFRLEIEPAVELPRRADGTIDVRATGQLLNDKVEEWVREHPGQWQWFHDRWAIKHTL